MFTRTEKVTTSDHDDIDLDKQLCPPHDFDFGWASKPDAPGDDTLPALYCRACGEIRAFRLPADAP
jgi:hypothetical protein